jgi:hypothetical protein
MTRIDPNSTLYSYLLRLFAAKGVKTITEIWSRPSGNSMGGGSNWSARDYDTPQKVVNMIQENHVAQGLDPLQALRATQITLQAMIEAGLYPVVKSKAQKAMNEVNKRVKLEEEKRDTFKTPVIKKDIQIVKKVQYNGHNVEQLLSLGKEVKHKKSLGSASDGNGGTEWYISVWLEQEGRGRQDIFDNDVLCKTSEGDYVLILISWYHDLTDAEREIHFLAYDHVFRGETAGKKFNF